MSAAKKASVFLVAYVLAFVLISITPSFIHRREYDRAFFAYYKDPTPENAAALQAQQRIIGYIRLEIAAVGAFLVVSLGYGVHVAVLFADYSLKRIRGSNSQP